ncbi:anaerobic ribonucleoside triphosphate reductase [Paenibacillus spiritus]|uniref:Anaerobic ribonucleoside triphosphate reductase n=1 Tax=Paenibacillus spiritus TaxID=2496557 RepID=A0A5J5G2D5_9BACL|nr:anaerobic ribonucleoside triphosphate reductase [Paenibacillus spiritus]KAA9001018.1 anaerobic ribonucleoside triphosphate reductase [Paenibacillus spiritus]
MTLLEQRQDTRQEALLEEAIGIGDDIIDSRDLDLLRENANLNGESFSGKMSKLGSEYSKWYARHFTLPPRLTHAVRENIVYVHDLDQYVIGTTNCIFIPFERLLREGFNTGNGSVRPPNSIMTAMALTAIIFQSQQNAQYGGVSGSKLDHDLAPYVAKSFAKFFRKGLDYFGEGQAAEVEGEIAMGRTDLAAAYPQAFRYAMKETESETLQGAESLIHNLNTMSSRAGGQIPFTSINYGTCTSPEGQLVIASLLTATMNGLGSGETPVFPIQIFKCKQGINQQPGDPNYELFLKAAECSARRLYPNFANLDAPLNLAYYDPADPDTEFATMGCRTRVLGDRFGRNRCSGKGNLSFNTLNLVRLGIRHGMVTGQREEADEQGFYDDLDHYMEIALEGLVHRYRIQCAQKAKASDFMMREGVWEGGEVLGPEDPVGDLLKHGSLSIGFIGIAECMKAMYGRHHAEDPDIHAKAVAVVRRMRDFCDRKSEELDLNITLFATPAEGLSGKFTKIDRSELGAIPGVTDREYYTNSFHVPVYYELGAARKISLEAPFHELCNAGAISYVELNGNARSNPGAFVKIIRYALEQNVSYFSINHPIDRCSACGHEGVIGTNCPSCGAHEEEVHIRRLRRVTGYLTGDYQTRFNTAKQAEVRDRVKHL